MRPPTLPLFACLAALAAGSACALTAAGTATAPVGFVRHAIRPGCQTFAPALLHPDLASATVVGGSPRSLVVDAAEAGLRALLTGDAACYIEITEDDEDAFTGHRFDLDVPATLSADGSTLVLRDAGSNTLPLPIDPGQLAGCRVALRRHVTLAGLFGRDASSALRPARLAADADHVVAYDRAAGRCIAFYLHCDDRGVVDGWRRVDDSTPADAEIVPPGTGLFVVRRGSTAAGVLEIGTVRTNDFALRLRPGYSLAASGFPLRQPPAELLSAAAGSTAGISLEQPARLPGMDDGRHHGFPVLGVVAAVAWPGPAGAAAAPRMAASPSNDAAFFLRQRGGESVLLFPCPVDG